MGIFNRHQVSLDGIGFLLGRGGVLFSQESLLHALFLSFCNLRGKDIFAFQNIGYGRRRDADALMV